MKVFSVILIILSGAFSHALSADDIAPLKTVAIADQLILADMAEMTVYTFDADEGSTSTCYDACAKAWPPVLAPSGVELGKSLAVTLRNDGTQQLTHNGQPIYYYVGDGAPGEINGDGLGGVWHIIKIEALPVPL